MKKQNVYTKIFSKRNFKNVLLWFALDIIFAIPFGFEQSLVIVLPLIIPVHLNYYLLDKYYKNENYYKYAISIIITLFVFGIIAQGFGEIGFSGDIVSIRHIVYFQDSFIYSLNAALNPTIAVLLTTLYRFFAEKQQYKILEAENKRTEAEKEKAKAELSMLKQQINPHFLFNTLNNLFSMSTMAGDEATATGLGHLSHLMRYMIYDSNSDYVRLESELEMLHNFIDLQKLRINENLIDNITLIIKGDTSQKQIPSMLLISFVENAFKHGYTINSEFYINMEIIITNDYLYLNIENSINKDRKNNVESSGIGLENVKKRLDLLYKDQYLLEINETKIQYHISLKLPLKA